jgi:large subunit ribosomal protein L24
MRTEFATSWKKSKQPRKQRKYRIKAPLHTKGKFMNSHLSPELRKKHGKRSIRLRTGDKVTVMRGKFKGKEGKVENINVKKEKVYISKIEHTKKDGTKVQTPLKPSNLMITEPNLDDKRRRSKLEK